MHHLPLTPMSNIYAYNLAPMDGVTPSSLFLVPVPVPELVPVNLPHRS